LRQRKAVVKSHDYLENKHQMTELKKKIFLSREELSKRRSQSVGGNAFTDTSAKEEEAQIQASML